MLSLLTINPLFPQSLDRVLPDGRRCCISTKNMKRATSPSLSMTGTRTFLLLSFSSFLLLVDSAELAGILVALSWKVTVSSAHALVERIAIKTNAHGLFLLSEKQFLEAMLSGKSKNVEVVKLLYSLVFIVIHFYLYCLLVLPYLSKNEFNTMFTYLFFFW